MDQQEFSVWLALNPFIKNMEKMQFAFQKIYVLDAGLVMKKMHYLMLFITHLTRVLKRAKETTGP
jgi:hypothetical protein